MNHNDRRNLSSMSERLRIGPASGASGAAPKRHVPSCWKARQSMMNRQCSPLFFRLDLRPVTSHVCIIDDAFPTCPPQSISPTRHTRIDRTLPTQALCWELAVLDSPACQDKKAQKHPRLLFSGGPRTARLRGHKNHVGCWTLGLRLFSQPLTNLHVNVVADETAFIQLSVNNLPCNQCT